MGNYTYICKDGTELEYDSEWKMPNNTIRQKLEEDLEYLLVDLSDLGYSVKSSGWSYCSNSPYIRISNGLEKMDFDKVESTTNRIKSYFGYNGFESSVEILKKVESVYIYFNLIYQYEKSD